MYNTPPPHLMQGIHLLQAGQRTDALNYLRHAVRTEAIPADGWLWLAAATDDREEYRFCVNQALHLDSRHPTARRMLAELERQDRQAGGWTMPSPGMPGAPGAAYAGAGYDSGYGAGFEGEYTLARDLSARRPSRLRRLVRILALTMLIGGCLGIVASLAVSGMIQDLARDWLQIQDGHTLTFDVSSPAFRFRVEVPESWIPANTDSSAWRDTRDSLAGRFPVPDGQRSVWDDIEESFSAAVRDPVYGDMLQQPRIVETDPDLLADQGAVAALALVRVVRLPQDANNPALSVCDRLARAGHMLETEQAPSPDNLIESRLVERDPPGDCVYRLHVRMDGVVPFLLPGVLTDTPPAAARLITLAIPVGAERYAVWTLTFADSAAAAYADALERITETLEYRE